ncbi:hypothetical protein [Shewanella cutis]|uniref:Uncharacterized protein n=1 Tax=Shewanella cutis TaxID=2766780 RepID=A0ABS9QXP0_9GAMM|nr:hypothetical protein [Shewanella sp. PS-2]MCG9964216.1 hypothetical protein [Shewanella sp. PS-2]
MEEKKISDVVFDFIENMDALNESAPLVLSTEVKSSEVKSSHPLQIALFRLLY